MAKRRVVLSWSSGKDSAWCLHELRQDPDVVVVGLLTTFNRDADRVAMHAVRRELVKAQARVAGLPLYPVELPWPCSNQAYEAAMQAGIDELGTTVDFDAVAFGDLFLEDVRAYRERQVSAWGVQPLFPLWSRDTRELAATMIDAGIAAFLTCVDPAQCPARFAGRAFDASLIRDLPASVDHCGENGEFHTFVTDGPMFASPVAAAVGEVVERDGFVFVDLVPT